jgi:hypothetical protein
MGGSGPGWRMVAWYRIAATVGAIALSTAGARKAARKNSCSRET